MGEGASYLPGVELAPGVWTDRSELRFGFSRSGGPGGQNVNKVNTKTELRVRPVALHGMSERARQRFLKQAGHRIIDAGDLLITSETERTQDANRQACLRKLRVLIERALVEPKRRRKTKPSRASQERRLKSKKTRGEVKRGRSAVRGE